MELRYLITFEKVAHCKSYSKAAQLLFISQPAVTSHIIELERELGTRLFYRNKSPIQITETGQIFLDYTKQILELVRQGKHAVSNFGKGMSGDLTISISESVSFWLLPFLNKFKNFYPTIDAKVDICLSPLTIEKVLNREVSFGIIRTCSPFFSNASLTGIKIQEDEVKVVFSPRCKLVSDDVVTLEQLKRQPIIKFGGNTDAWSQIVDLLEKDGADYDATIEVDNSQAVKILLQQQPELIAFMPAMSVWQELKEGLLESRPIRDIAKISRYSVLIHRKDAALSDISTNFIKMLSLECERQKPFC